MSHVPPTQSAYDRFLASMVMDYEKWHDGIGYDLVALREMTAEERRRIAATLAARRSTWREVEALAVLRELGAAGTSSGLPPHAVDAGGLPSTGAAGALERALDDPLPDTRLAAAEVLLAGNRHAEFDRFLAREIRRMTRLQDGLTRALLLAERYPSDAIKQALLYASWNRTECAIHCAALLCYLCGAADSAFDMEMRPLFLRLGPHQNTRQRHAAFDELCRLCNMTLEPAQRDD